MRFALSGVAPQAPRSRSVAPFLISILIIPCNRSSALCHALFESNRMDDLGPWFAAFIPCRGKGMVFAWMNRILQTEFDGVKIQGTRDLFHVTVERPVSLRDAIATERARRRRVRVHDVCIEADVGRLTIFSIANIQRH